MALSLDGSAHFSSGSTAAPSVNLTTKLKRDLIFANIVYNTAVPTAVSGAGLIFNLLARAPAGAGQGIDLWWALAPAPLVNQTITATLGSTNFATFDVFAVNGAVWPAGVDPNGSVVNSVSGADLTFNCAAPGRAMLISGARFGSTASPTAGSGWTLISGADFTISQYQVVNGPYRSIAAIGTGSGNQFGQVGVSIMEDPPSPRSIGMII